MDRRSRSNFTIGVFLSILGLAMPVIMLLGARTIFPPDSGPGKGVDFRSIYAGCGSCVIGILSGVSIVSFGIYMIFSVRQRTDSENSRGFEVSIRPEATGDPIDIEEEYYNEGKSQGLKRTTHSTLPQRTAPRPPADVEDEE